MHRSFRRGRAPGGLPAYVLARIPSLVLEAPARRAGVYSTRIEVDPRAIGLA